MDLKKELESMNDLINMTKARKILRLHHQDFKVLDDEEIKMILLKADEKELEVLCFCLNLNEHISAYIFDCLIKLKSLRKQT